VQKGWNADIVRIKPTLTLKLLRASYLRSNVDTIKLLLDYQANVNHQNDQGWTPLMAAATLANASSSSSSSSSCLLRL